MLAECHGQWRSGSNQANGFQAASRLGRALIAAAEETLAHFRGEIKPESQS
jgi:hypothetical protein